ncbi:hypothetical protein PLANTIT3_20224 [Plantibacter sp. T3]|nr:hypothetical protein PLANTIT3_20224 [Plantibacter sp. T3]
MAPLAADRRRSHRECPHGRAAARPPRLGDARALRRRAGRPHRRLGRVGLASPRLSLSDLRRSLSDLLRSLSLSKGAPRQVRWPVGWLGGRWGGSLAGGASSPRSETPRQHVSR